MKNIKRLCAFIIICSLVLFTLPGISACAANKDISLTNGEQNKTVMSDEQLPATDAGTDLEEFPDADTNLKEFSDAGAYLAEFPDANFRDKVLSLLNEEDSGNRTDSSIVTSNDLTLLASIPELVIYDMNIADMTGLKYFTGLENLSCSGNQLTSLDLSNNSKLKHFLCTSNQLTALDVSKNTVLKDLDCSYNQLTVLDLSKNTVLWDLDCSTNQLTALDVSKNTVLESLNCNDNQLTALDVSKNTALVILSCSYNQLTALDVSNNTELRRLRCYNNNMTSPDNVLGWQQIGLIMDDTFKFYPQSVPQIST